MRIRNPSSDVSECRPFIKLRWELHLAFPNRMAALNAPHQLARLTRLAGDAETLRVTKRLPAQEQNYNVVT